MTMPTAAQEAIFIVRHAERTDRSSDSTLSADGEARAERLARHLRDAGIDAIYSTSFRRTLGTAAPLSEALGLEVQTEPTLGPDPMGSDDGVSRYIEGLVARLGERHATDRVVVVGHSNTLPALLAALGHPEEISIAGDEYDNLFVVLPQPVGPPTMLRIRF
ncbi:MAG: phosphoglycerate mutase family protein [Vicinamibacterales bacterium]|nr:phosphoglycerate mutase family protein [Vicinamibacterales bacterium]